MENMQSINGQLFKFKTGDIITYNGTIYSGLNSNKPKDIGQHKEYTILCVEEGKHPYLIMSDDEYGVYSGYADENNIKQISFELSQITAKEIYLGNKYFGNNVPFVCMMTNSSCFKKNQKMIPVGIVWNSTGENKPYLKNYVQPTYKEDWNYNDIIKIIGLNDRGDDYNHTLRNDGYHAWIGLDDSKNILSVQTLPWNYRAAGCGMGEVGSADNGWIQINICENVLNNHEYFSEMYGELINLTAYLCELFEIDPFGSAPLNDFSDKICPTIMDHHEANKLGVATSRQDVFHWFKKYDLNMRKAREDVQKLIQNTVSPYAKLNNVQTNKVNVSKQTFPVVVNVNKLNVRSGPSLDYEVLYVASKDTFFIVEEQDGWGHIIEDDGWIDLQFTKRLESEPLE